MFKNNHINYFKAQKILKNIVNSPIKSKSKSGFEKEDEVESSRTVLEIKDKIKEYENELSFGKKH